MDIPILQVDAFADRVFEGNPAAVCPLLDWLSDERMQAIAAENNLSETAFIVPTPTRYQLRWFTPKLEVDLCGHATLAAAHVIFTRLRTDVERVEFETRSGLLTVDRGADGMLTMDFPAVVGTPAPLPEWTRLLGAAEPTEALKLRETHAAEYWMLVYGEQAHVADLQPMFSELGLNVVATARADPSTGLPGDPDFVSRFFAPASGIDEDPVTGSAHCSLAPYWAERCGRPRVVGRQISTRGGTVICEVDGDRVRLSGRCADYLEGTLSLG